MFQTTRGNPPVSQNFSFFSLQHHKFLNIDFMKNLIDLKNNKLDYNYQNNQLQTTSSNYNNHIMIKQQIQEFLCTPTSIMHNNISIPIADYSQHIHYLDEQLQNSLIPLVNLEIAFDICSIIAGISTKMPESGTPQTTTLADNLDLIQSTQKQADILSIRRLLPVLPFIIHHLNLTTMIQLFNLLQNIIFHYCILQDQIYILDGLKILNKFYVFYHNNLGEIIFQLQQYSFAVWFSQTIHDKTFVFLNFQCFPRLSLIKIN
ncbi:unnamed protein product (macronuclear) [Paramecium tetraurelia]|uniref:Uncharacterized protein n=1 Tax=Paramecium tetraurelia TaxID=5888 RepID=A0D2X1_PARTE|nr:uncharacterized protein GSPATT00039216001 [Paramecium tetraurelia]CAK77388.1 unnamed protein product [Paramecium tetraurelia]|eukprot:XP_001444785.1 hypothetical protein (macronuclear) [Paramecium tetraurelia strain d4-2]